MIDDGELAGEGEGASVGIREAEVLAGQRRDEAAVRRLGRRRLERRLEGRADGVGEAHFLEQLQRRLLVQVLQQ